MPHQTDVLVVGGGATGSGIADGTFRSLARPAP